MQDILFKAVSIDISSPMPSQFDSVESIIDFLRDASVSSSSATVEGAPSKEISSKKQRKGKTVSNLRSITPSPPSLAPQVSSKGEIENLPKGRVRYGPITVNPRKQPSKTLYTGRRSKYEVLSGDEEDKRRDRRERNRVAATKCREKRDHILVDLEATHRKESNNHKQLTILVANLENRKHDLESRIANHLVECLTMNDAPLVPAMIFGDLTFLSSMPDAPPPPLPAYQQTTFQTDEEELSHLLDQPLLLTNSAYTTDDSNSMLLPQQSQHPLPPPLQLSPVMTMTTSSIDRLFNTIQTPTVSMESGGNQSMLFNSAFGSSCAKQHSNSSEDDSLPPARPNPCVY